MLQVSFYNHTKESYNTDTVLDAKNIVLKKDFKSKGDTQDKVIVPQLSISLT